MPRGYQSLHLVPKSMGRTTSHSFACLCWENWKSAFSCWLIGIFFFTFQYSSDPAYVSYFDKCPELKFFFSNRIPEAALMARSYLPSKVSEIVAIWRRDLNKVTIERSLCGSLQMHLVVWFCCLNFVNLVNVPKGKGLDDFFMANKIALFHVLPKWQ